VKALKQRAETSQLLTLTSIPQQLFLIIDTDFSPLELGAYRSKYFDYTNNPVTQGCYPVVLRYLWNHHGLTFSNEALRSAVLAVILPRVSEAYESRVSRFRRAMMKSLQGGKVEKEHVFAVFFLVMHSFNYTSWIHILGFEAVLRHLIQQSSPIRNFNSDIPLIDIFGYMILEVQRRAMGMTNVTSDERIHKLISDLRSLSRQLQHPSSHLASLLGSTFLSASFPNLAKTHLLGGLGGVLLDIEVHLFQFVHETVREDENAATELHIAQEKLEIFESDITVTEVFERVRASSRDGLTVRLEVKTFVGFKIHRIFYRSYVMTTLHFDPKFACIDVSVNARTPYWITERF
jgi:hypothetical protein